MNGRLPIVQPFSIPSLGWDLKDYRALTLIEKTRVEFEFYRSVIDHTKSQGLDSDEFVCRNDSLGAPERREARFKLALRSDPSVLFSDFRKTDVDPRSRRKQRRDRSMIFLAIKRGRDWIGGISISNIERESETATLIKATSLIWVGVVIPSGDDELDTWMTAIQHVIENNLPFEDGTEIDIVGYDYTTDESLKGSLSARPRDLLFIKKLSEMMVGSTVPHPITGDLKFRRAGALVS